MIKDVAKTWGSTCPLAQCQRPVWHGRQSHGAERIITRPQRRAAARPERPQPAAVRGAGRHRLPRYMENDEPIESIIASGFARADVERVTGSSSSTSTNAAGARRDSRHAPQLWQNGLALPYHQQIQGDAFGRRRPCGPFGHPPGRPAMKMIAVVDRRHQAASSSKKSAKPWLNAA